MVFSILSMKGLHSRICGRPSLTIATSKIVIFMSEFEKQVLAFFTWREPLSATQLNLKGFELEPASSAWVFEKILRNVWMIDCKHAWLIQVGVLSPRCEAVAHPPSHMEYMECLPFSFLNIVEELSSNFQEVSSILLSVGTKLVYTDR